MALGHAFGRVLTAARANEPWAFAQIYRDLSPSVAGYLRVQGAREPDDLASEVFLGLLRGLPGFTGDEARFRAWVFTIAHRRLTDERRRLARRPEGALPGDDPGGDGLPPAGVAGGDVEEEALRRMSTARVRRLCAALPPDQRDVLLLRLMADMTVGDVAEALGRTPGAVKALQHRAVVALRGVVEREGVTI